MLRISLQFFAHKKAEATTKNAADTKSNRNAVTKADGRTYYAGN